MYTKITKDNSLEIAKQYIRAFSGNAWDVTDVESRILEYINHPLFRGYVKIENDEIVSAAFGILQQYYDGLRYFLTDLFTTPNYQNQGHATQLLDYVKEQLETEKIKQIMLISLDDDLHNHFYNEKNGFVTRNELCIKRFVL